MHRYLRPDLPEAAGIQDFNTWAATFGQVVEEMELSVAGGDRFKLKCRFAKFQNVPELLKMFHTFADLKTAEDLKLPVPALAPRDGDGAAAAEHAYRGTQPRTARVHPGHRPAGGPHSAKARGRGGRQHAQSLLGRPQGRPWT
jgi:hypothetical protein